MDIFYLLITLEFIVIIYLLFIKNDKVEDEDDNSIHDNKNTIEDTMLDLKLQNDKLKLEVDNLQKEIKKIETLSNQIDTLAKKTERILSESTDTQTVDIETVETIKTKSGFTITYSDIKKYQKLERNLKKYSMRAYKKLVFEYYPSIENENYVGELIKEDNNIFTYELVLPTDSMFSKVYGDLKLIYSVNIDEKNIIFETIEPENILLDGYKSELTKYKGVMISKEYRDRDIFKINLLNMLENDNERKDK